MLIPNVISTYLVLVDFKVNRRRLMSYNPAIRCHPEEDGLQLESGSSQELIWHPYFRKAVFVKSAIQIKMNGIFCALTPACAPTATS